jgi:hypothetical protein
VLQAPRIPPFHFFGLGFSFGASANVDANSRRQCYDCRFFQFSLLISLHALNAASVRRN